MSVFTEAVKAVKAKIEALGGKKYEIEDPSKKSSLFQNQLQAVWNIASILEGTMDAKTGEPKSLTALVAYIFWYKSTLESSLECLAPGSTKGTIDIPDIPDLNTYQLVIALHKLLEVAVAQNSVSGSDVQKLFASIPQPPPSKDTAAPPPPTIIDTLMGIDAALLEKIELFKEAKRREEASLLATYTMRLAEFIRPLSPPNYPSCIKDNGTGQISYTITRSTLAAQTDRLEADCAAFTALMTQLNLYQEVLLVTEGKCTASLPPIPSDIVDKGPFEEALKAFGEDLSRNLNELKARQRQVSLLIQQAKAELQSINDELLTCSSSRKEAKLTEYRSLLAATTAKATASQHTYSASKGELAAFSDITPATLGYLEEETLHRRRILTTTQDELRAISIKLKPPYAGLYESTFIGKLLDLLNAPAEAEEIRRLLTTAKARKDHCDSLFAEAMRKKHFWSTKPENSLPTDAEFNAAIKTLIEKITATLGKISAELAVDIKAPLRPGEARQEGLYTLHTRYQRAQQILIQRSNLPLLKFEMLYDALEESQADLTLQLTEWDFKVQEVNATKINLESTFASIDSLDVESALKLFETQAASIRALRTWLDLAANKELYASLLEKIDHLSQRKRDLLSFSFRAPATIEARKEALKLKADSLEARKKSADEAHLALHTLAERLAQKEKELKIKRLQALAPVLTIQKPVDKTSAEELLATITPHLEKLTESAAFIQSLRSSNDPEISPHVARVAQQQESLLMTRKNALIVQKASQLKLKFFGAEKQLSSQELAGEFGNYLTERATTFWLRDLFSQYIALLFGQFGYMPTATLRRQKLHELQFSLDAYREEPNEKSYQALIQKLEHNINLFSPRARQGQAGYEKSLHHRLSTFKAEIEKIHVSPDDEPQNTVN